MPFTVSYFGDQDSSQDWLRGNQLPHRNVEQFRPSAGSGGFAARPFGQVAVAGYYYRSLVHEELHPGYSRAPQMGEPI